MMTKQLVHHCDMASQVVARLNLISFLVLEAAECASPSVWDVETLAELSIAVREQARKLAESLATLDEKQEGSQAVPASQPEGGAR